jgi:hypothetical protein
MADVNTSHRGRLLNDVRTLAPLIREHTDEAERERRLSPPVVTAFEAGIFRMYTPCTLGGLEVDPLTFYHVVEAVAHLDGSTRWCVLIAGGNLLLGTYLADQAAAEVFGRGPHVVTAGVIFPYGTAVVRDEGYRVDGHWWISFTPQPEPRRTTRARPRMRLDALGTAPAVVPVPRVAWPSQFRFSPTHSAYCEMRGLAADVHGCGWLDRSARGAFGRLGHHVG